MTSPGEQRQTTLPAVGAGAAAPVLPTPRSRLTPRPPTHQAGQASRIREIIARDLQMVFLLPGCRSARPTPHGPKHNLEYKAEWGNVKSQVETTAGALRAADINPWKVGQETVSFHSHGAKVIEKLMKDDQKGNLLRADRLELHDCLYEERGREPFANRGQTSMRWHRRTRVALQPLASTDCSHCRM